MEQFGRLKPPEFSRVELEDAPDFLYRRQRILCTTSILDTSGVTFTIFQLKRVAYRWWHAYELSKLGSISPHTSHEFSFHLLDKFVPQTRKEELRRDFEQLCHRDMCVTQYEIRIADLARHTVWLVPTEKEREVGKFIDGLNYCLHYSLA